MTDHAIQQTGDGLSQIYMRLCQPHRTAQSSSGYCTHAASFLKNCIPLVSGNSGGFWLSKAVSLGCDAPLPTPMPLYPFGQMPRD